MNTNIQIVEKPQHRLYCLLSDKVRIVELRHNIEILSKKQLSKAQGRHKIRWLMESKVALWCLQNPHKIRNVQQRNISLEPLYIAGGHSYDI